MPGVIASEGMEAYPAEVRCRFPQTNPMKRRGDVLHIGGGGALWGDPWAIPKPDYFREG